MLLKIRDLRTLCDSCALQQWIEADGGQNGEDAARSIAVGANAIVARSTIFGAGDYAQAIGALRPQAQD